MMTLASGCASLEESKARKAERESYQNPFYLKYLDSNSRLDREIYSRIESLRVDRSDPVVHNELGALLFQRRFPEHAMEELDKALALDKRFYPAWHNIGLVHLAAGRTRAAERAFAKAVRIKPGFAEAHFHLGLVFEMQGRRSAAIDHYATAFGINWALLDPRVNPRIVDSSLRARALMKLYTTRHPAAAARFMGPHSDYFFQKPGAAPVQAVEPEPEPVPDPEPEPGS